MLATLSLVWGVECFYYDRFATTDDTILCFANLPLLFNVKAKVVVFLQNRFLIDNNRPILEGKCQKNQKFECNNCTLF